MRKVILFLSCFLFATVIFSQEEKIKEIRDLYAKTQENIAACLNPETASTSGLYCNELTVNSTNGSWRAVGNYLKTIKFWYTDDPTLDGEDNDLMVLSKIEVNSNWAVGNKNYTEFLYNDGKLVFSFQKDASYAYIEKPFETRWYFADEKPILYMEGQEIKTIPSAEQIQKMSKSLTRLFLETFN